MADDQTTAHDKLDAIAHDSASDTSPSAGPGLRIERSTKKAPELDTSREVPLWERDDAPDGSTESSLLVYEDGKPVRVSGPTHYQHNADGSITGGFGIGTHVDTGDRIVPILAHYQG